MPAVFPKQVKRREIYQRFNLKELLGYEPNKQQKEAFASRLVDEMVMRTASGKDVNNKEFREYERSYAKKKGVGIRDVDLILSGDMLGSITESVQKNVVKVQIEGDFAVDKAHGHITGRATGKVRDFFGFNSEDDLRDIVEEVDQLRDDQPEPQVSGDDIIDLAALRTAIMSIGIDQVE